MSHKNADPLEAAKVKLKAPIKGSDDATSSGAAATSATPPTPPEPPPSLEDEKKIVNVASSLPAPVRQKLRVICDNPKKPYVIHVGGQAITLRDGKILDPNSYTPQALKAFQDHKVKFEPVVETPAVVEDA